MVMVTVSCFSGGLHYSVTHLKKTIRKLGGGRESDVD
jgi:hypothetical protein